MQYDCIAKMRLDDNLVAVWTASSVYKESIDIQAETIRNLIEYGLGKEENFPALKASLRYKSPRR